MSDLGDIRVVLTAVTAQFKREMAGAVASLKSVKSEARDVAVSGAAAMAAFGAAIYKGIKGLDEQNRAMLKLQAATAGRAFNTDAIAAYAGELQKLTTFGDDATISAAGTLARYVQTDKQVVQLLPHIQDLAEATGQDLNSAAQLAGRAISGNAHALQGMGVAMTEAQKKAFATADAQERLRIVTQALTQNYGGVAQAVGKTATGAFKIMNNAIGEVLESVAALMKQPLASLFGKIADAAFRLSDGINKLSGSGKTLLVVAGAAANAMLALVTGLSAVAYILPTIVDGWKKLIVLTRAFAAAASAAFLPVLAYTAAIAAGIAGVILIVGAMKMAWDENLFGMRDTVKGFVSTIKNYFEKLFTWLADKWKGVGDTVSEFAIWAGTKLTGGSDEDAQGSIDAMHASHQNLLSVGEGSGAADFWGDVKDELVAGAKGVGRDIAKVWGNGIGVFKDLAASAMALIPPLEEEATFTKEANKALQGLPSALMATKVLFSDLVNIALAKARLRDASEATQRGFGSGVHLAATQVQNQAADFETWARKRDAMQQNMYEGLAAAGSNIVGALGEFGGTINNTITAFTQGGPIAALATFFADLLTKTQGFGRIVKVVTSVFGDLVGALEPFTEALLPIVQLVGTVVKALAGPIKIAMQVLGAQMKAWAAVMRVLLIGIAYVVKGIAGIWNGIIGAIASIFKKLGSISILGAHPLGFLGHFGDAIERAKINLDGLNRTIENLKHPESAFADGAGGAGAAQASAEQLKATIETLKKYGDKYADEIAYLQGQLAKVSKSILGAADLNLMQVLFDTYSRMGTAFGDQMANAILGQIVQVQGAMEDSVDRTRKGFNGLSETVEKLNKEMSNVPQGFKDTLYRFNATVAGMGGGSGAMQRDLGTGGNANQQVPVEIHIHANDMDQVVDAVGRALDRRNVRISGSPVSNGQTLAPAKNRTQRQFGG